MVAVLLRVGLSHQQTGSDLEVSCSVLLRWGGKWVYVLVCWVERPKTDGSVLCCGKMNTEICACLGEWYKDAQSKGKENFARAFQKALKSVEKFPDVITSVEQTRGIKGVGPYIAARIEKHFRESGRDGSSTFRRTRTGNVEKKSRTYDPKYRSAPFALLVALRETEIELDTLNMPLPKAELIAIAQRHCDEPLVKVGSRIFTQLLPPPRPHETRKKGLLS